MTTDQPALWLRGDVCGLGPLRLDLAELYWSIDTEPAVMAGFGGQTPGSLEDRTRGIEAQLSNSGDAARFTVYDLTEPDPVPVGMTELLIQHRWRTAEYTIQIGQAGRGKRIGTEATVLTLDYAWHITNLLNVYLTVNTANTAAIKAYQTAGFQEIGRRRQSALWYGQRTDELLMDAIPTDFPHPSRITPGAAAP